MDVGFIGTRACCTQEQLAALNTLLRDKLTKGTWFHHGGRFGADYEAHCIAWQLGANIWLHPVKDTRSQAEFDPESVRYSSPPASHPISNASIVMESDVLIVVVESFIQDDSRPWKAVGYAKIAKKPVYVVLPTGKWYLK